MPGVREAVNRAMAACDVGAGNTGSSFRAAAARVLALAFFALLPGLPSAAADAETTLPDADWTAIKAIIAEQLTALKAGDGTKAFAYASPSIRQQFGNATDFLTMVRTAYGALITARYTEFLEGALIDGNVIQPLRLIAPDNSVRVALYTMQKQPDGRWKISGCVLAPSTVQAA